MFIDPLYLMLALPGLLLAVIASAVVRGTFSKYSNKAASSRLTGAAAADRILRSQGITGVRIEMTAGSLSDHYDPRTRTLRLSEQVYRSASLSAIGVACHEAGHALQHAQSYAPLALRSALVPVTQFGSQAAWFLFVIGWFMRFPVMMQIGAIFFIFAVVFTIVTLPVEWDASVRAKRLMVSAGIVSQSESRQAGAVLNAAFLTYVAGVVTAVLTLLYYLIRSGLIGGRR